jgi:hypothetical protein
VTLLRLLAVSKLDVVPCKWTHVDSRDRSKATVDGYNNFLGDKMGDYNSFFIV